MYHNDKAISSVKLAARNRSVAMALELSAGCKLLLRELEAVNSAAADLEVYREVQATAVKLTQISQRISNLKV